MTWKFSEKGPRFPLSLQYHKLVESLRTYRGRLNRGHCERRGENGRKGADEARLKCKGIELAKPVDDSNALQVWIYFVASVDPFLPRLYPPLHEREVNKIKTERERYSGLREED